MTTQELLEMASLDAMGLLEEDEREAYERAFAAAPPQVQATIRREQARFARPDSILPPVDPPAGLRARVLAAIREAMRAQPAMRDAIPFQPEILPSRGVNRWWRAAAVGAMAASIAFSLGMLQMHRDYGEITRNLERNAYSDILLKQYGVQFEQSLFNHNTQFVGFEPASDFRGRALLLIDGEKGSGQIFVKDLPTEPGEYELVVMDESGKVASALLTLRGSDSGMSRHEIPAIPADVQDRLAIITRDARSDAAVSVLKSNSL